MHADNTLYPVNEYLKSRKMSDETNKNIVVVGSCMIDFVSFARRLPKPGETIHGTKFMTNFGGKGANQCVAAAKLGARTALVARVGDDLWGDKYIKHLKGEGINADFVKKTAKFSSGIAQITVSECGENQIVIIAGANSELNAKDVTDAKNLISTAAVVVLQLETSTEVALKTLQITGGVSILNGAPALSQYDPRLLELPSIFCVNETEAAIFTGLPVDTIPEAENAARDLINKGCKSVILTLGAQGLVYLSKNEEVVRIAAPRVKCIDSTGAGDSFIGALAYLLANQRGLSMEKILETCCFIASDSVTKPGTQISFPGTEILKTCPFSDFE